MDFETLTSAIEQADIITLYRHEHPDCDALGSQFGLFTWLKDNYPDKKIYALGAETTKQYPFPKSDIVDDETIKKSLAIVLDTANQARVDDKRFASARQIIKIDHHPDREPFGDPRFVNTKAAATCQILAGYFQQAGKLVTKETATFLYCGLLTDTLNYSTSNTTAESLKAGAYLAGFGLDLAQINRDLFDRTKEEFAFSSFTRSKIQVLDNKVAYVIFSHQDQQKYHMTASQCREYVTEMGHVKDFQAWAVFTEKESEGRQLYDGSLRAKTMIVNDLAEKYHGGGHPQASGVKNLTGSDVQELLKSLISRAE